MKKYKLNFIWVLCIGFLVSCKTIPNQQTNAAPSSITMADEIIFEYHDASVPPDDHRSYFIRIKEDSLFYSVDSYGEIIKENSMAIDLKKWKSIKNAFESCGIKNVEERKNSEGCTGGSGNSIYAYVKKEQLFKGYQYRCSDFFDGDLDGDLNCFLMTIKQDIASDFFHTD
ncbi:MAG: hypothetical protein P8K10_04950 [Crocinitomicaceae bacterium]|nr:hypothetical protein [Crocinitomicaceae bacterium]